MCPMDGKCNNQNMIYQAKVTTPTSRETYIGLCDTTFKLRYRNHVCSFKNERYKHATELSKYIWSLKDKSIYIYIYIYYIYSTLNSNTSPQRVLNNKGVGAGYIYRGEWTTFSLKIDKLVS